MYAVIRTGGQQHRVQVGDTVHIPRLAGKPGDALVFDQVLAVGEGESARVGTPTVDGAQVKATLVDHARGDKVLIYTYKRRQNSNRRRAGHRQELTTVKIEAIEG